MGHGYVSISLQLAHRLGHEEDNRGHIKRNTGHFTKYMNDLDPAVHFPLLSQNQRHNHEKTDTLNRLGRQGGLRIKTKNTEISVTNTATPLPVRVNYADLRHIDSLPYLVTIIRPGRTYEGDVGKEMWKPTLRRNDGDGSDMCSVANEMNFARTVLHWTPGGEK